MSVCTLAWVAAGTLLPSGTHALVASELRAQFGMCGSGQHHSDEELDFSHERNDIAIRFGHGQWTDALIGSLMIEEVQVVCSPVMLENRPSLTSPNQLEQYRPIDHSTRQDSCNIGFVPSMRTFLKSAGVRGWSASS